MVVMVRVVRVVIGDLDLDCLMTRTSIWREEISNRNRLVNNWREEIGKRNR